MASSDLVWLITGTSAGLGKDLALAALARGDKVIATTRARSFPQLKDLEAAGAAVLELDVTAPLETLHEAAKKAVDIYGRIDVLVNNAGYICVGTLEELTPEETLANFNTNTFGGLNVARAFLPYMRERRSGTILWMGSIAGWQANPYSGIYGATKWALKAISRSFDKEIASLGLRSISIDWGYTRTTFLAEGQRAAPVSRISDYRSIVDETEAALQAYNGKQPGDPKKGVQAMVDMVHLEGKFEGVRREELPLNLLLGSDAYKFVKGEIEQDSEMLEKWKHITTSTDIVE
ncbi:hypothetical protein D9611_012146 [Ephemerocybe angulata]|uniref:NAD(P)-binding protein n=1 Tax=Ephemerocybe angulata TaxID=980116 RepID=A0A8H5FGC6_9AGAR|nr:hypothetical protein D9611_012146 [Tulosesus angulatus]